jgi:hypothetical protein
MGSAGAGGGSARRPPYDEPDLEGLAVSDELRNIRRVEHHYFHGFAVCFKRRRVVVALKYFRDMPGREESLARARRYRDRMERALPPPSRYKSTYVRNTTGTVGVFEVIQPTRAGTLVRYFGAGWTELDGTQRKRVFSTLKYGVREAKARAKEARRAALARILSHRGPLPARAGRGRRHAGARD